MSPAQPLLEVGLGGCMEGLVVREHGQHDCGGVDHVVPVRLHTKSACSISTSYGHGLAKADTPGCALEADVPSQAVSLC